MGLGTQQQELSAQTKSRQYSQDLSHQGKVEHSTCRIAMASISWANMRLSSDRPQNEFPCGKRWQRYL